MNNISLGVKLTSLREQMGLTQDDIASKIHVRTTVVADIENDLLTNTPAVFIKGYVRSYAEIVGLPQEEYQPYLDALSQQNISSKIKNYSKHGKNRKHGRWLLLISVLIIIGVLSVTAYCVWEKKKNNYVEVSHYISPTPTEHVNS